MNLNFIKQRVRDLRAYSLAPDRAAVKLNQNENPWDAPERIKTETLRRAAKLPWSRYPDFVSQKLHERLAAFCGWKPDGVIAGNGSNELIQALLMISVEPGKRVLINEPTFALYRQITTVLGGELITVPLNENLGYDIARLRAQVETDAPDVIIICSPNNPTGCVIETADLVSLLELTNGLVVVDAAYEEFSGGTILPLLHDYQNLVVLHTFSKAMALAGLRLGYLLADPQLVREVRKAVLPYNLNVISQTAAEVMLELFEPTVQPLVQSIIRERERLYGELPKISGLSPVKSRANFMAVRSVIPPRRVFEELLRRDILIRDISGYPMLQDYFRVSVGKPEENDLLVTSLREICESEAVSR
jgi:histidinol-phosphate aminotransferase